MTALVLVQGSIYRGPERKTSARGNEYAAATIREANGDATRYWSISAFNDACLALLRLETGDGVAVQGTFDARVYEKAGEARIGFSIMANSVMPLRQRKALKRDRQIDRPPPAKKRTPLARHPGDGVDVFGDSVPF